VDRNLANAVAGCGTVTIEGVFYRHASIGSRPTVGSDAGGRWGRAGAYPVLYLGRPPESIAVEAYRHLVDPFPGMTGEMVAPRLFYTYQLRVAEILDLTSPANLEAVGLAPGDLKDQLDRCQAVGGVAHQLNLHGVLTPAATGLGETLALFTRHLPAEELPRVLERTVWEVLPADPRKFRVIKGEAAEG
jgi:RES domain-containing protein